MHPQDKFAPFTAYAIAAIKAYSLTSFSFVFKAITLDFNNASDYDFTDIQIKLK